MSHCIVIIGRTGSGKSSIARRVAAELALPYISSGDIARQIAEQDIHTRLGLERGDWAPESAIRTEVMAQAEAAILQDDGFVMDGFPRTLEQLILLESLECDIRYFNLDLDELTCIRRCLQRRRKDDTPDAIALRLRSFRSKTQEMLDAMNGGYSDLNTSADLEGLVGQVLYALNYQQAA